MRALFGGLTLSLLAGCAAQEGAPADYASLTSEFPAAQQASFDMRREIGVAVAACVASELQGPASLQQLRSQGYTPIKNEFGKVFYAKKAVRTGLLAPDQILVSDTGADADCSIGIPRRDGATYFTEIGDALRSQGFVRVAGGRQSPRYARGDFRLMQTGSSSVDQFLADIDIGLVTGATDKTCQDPSLPASARQGC